MMLGAARALLVAASACAVLHPAAAPTAFYLLWALLGLQRAQSPWIALLRLGELAAFYLIGVCALAFAFWRPELATHRALVTSITAFATYTTCVRGTGGARHRSLSALRAWPGEGGRAAREVAA